MRVGTYVVVRFSPCSIVTHRTSWLRRKPHIGLSDGFTGAATHVTALAMMCGTGILDSRLLLAIDVMGPHADSRLLRTVNCQGSLP
jgi:hypothetical protein